MGYFPPAAFPRPMFRIEADLLIPGSGDPVKNGCVVIDGGTISYAGPAEGAPKPAAGFRTLNIPVVMPGMWDCHGHFIGIRSANVEEMIRTPVPVLSGRIVKDAERALAAGFTSIREPGGFGVYLSRIVDEGTVAGPHIYGAGASLSQTGGHGDFHSYPLDFVASLAERGWLTILCDGEAECRKGVRRNLRVGARLIKVLASGGVMSELDHPIHQQFSDEELRAIVDEAARADRIVAAHCHGKPGIVAALKAGCRTIEHGTYLDDESAEMIIERKATLVPTRFILERLFRFAKEVGVPDYALAKLQYITSRHLEALKLAIRKGVRIACGTDIYSSSGSPVGWGLNGNEPAYLVGAGMSPLKAIEAATANGPATLGPQAPKSGLLRAGYDADVLGVAGDPTRNIEVLANPASITHVWKSGTLAKAPAD